VRDTLREGVLFRAKTLDVRESSAAFQIECKDAIDERRIALP
jgi:hypothetical protein